MSGVEAGAQAARGSRTLGAIALILGALAVVVDQVTSVIRFASLYQGTIPTSVQPPIGNFIALVLAIVAIILGAIAWRRRAAGSILGAIGVGLGIAIAAPFLAYLIELLVVTLTQIANYRP
jgi:hypothetical protein